MTQDSLFDALVYANVPSRTVLTSVLQDGLLKKSIFSSNAFIYHFDDIRDAIDLVLRSLRAEEQGICDNLINSRSDMSYGVQRPLDQEDKHIKWISNNSSSSAPPPSSNPLVFHLNHTITNCLKMNELFDSEEVRFACSRTSQDLLNSLGIFKQPSANLPSATILITLDFLATLADGECECEFDNKGSVDNSGHSHRNNNGHSTTDTKNHTTIPFERVDVLMEKIKNLLIQFGGPILASSELKRNLQTGTTFKFFVEFYRISDCKKFLETSEQIDGPVVTDQNVQITFEGVNLFDIDRESLFFASSAELGGSILSERDCEPEPAHDRERECDRIEEDIISTPSSHGIISSISTGSSSAAGSTISISSSQMGSFEIDLWKIENGFERRTTCMIRNIPNKYTQQMIFDLVNESHAGCFDFLYLRMDFRNRCNVGYAFINFTRPHHILSFAKRVNGKRWARFNSDKVCHLTFARIQGTLALIEKFRNSKVMFEAPAYRPKLFQTDGPHSGQEIPFPT